MKQWVEYHSKDWDILVETGWITMYTETIDGKVMALMLKENKQ